MYYHLSHQADGAFSVSAIRVYRHLGDIAMVWSLDDIKNVEDLQLLSGHIHMMLGNLNKAQVSGPFLIARITRLL